MAQGVPGSLRPRIFLTFQHYKGGRPSAIRTGRLYPRRNTWYSLSEAESTSGHMVLSGERREKIHSDTTGNRSRDRPTSSAVPYPLRHPRPHINHTTGRNNTDETIYIIIYWLHIAYTGEYLARLSKHKFHNDSALWTCTCLV